MHDRLVPPIVVEKYFRSLSKHNKLRVSEDWMMILIQIEIIKRTPNSSSHSIL